MNEIITRDYVLFWGGIYSQWYIEEIKIENVTYNCCEQYMMAMKAKFFKDKESLDLIMSLDNPKEQKQAGRNVKNFDADMWSKVCFSVVFSGNYAKFHQNEDLKLAMMSTGDRIFVEASSVDHIWGIGLDQHTLEAQIPSLWRGNNLLGFALTTVKHELKK